MDHSGYGRLNQVCGLDARRNTGNGRQGGKPFYNRRTEIVVNSFEGETGMKRIVALFQENVFVRNSTILITGSMLMNALNYAFHAILGRMLDAETYGAVQSLIALLVIVSVPASTLGLVATKYGAKAKAHGDRLFGKHLFAYLNRRIVKYGGPLLALGLLLTPLVRSFLKIDDTLAVPLLWMIAALSFFSSVSIGVLSGWQKFGAVNTANIAGAGAKLTLGILFAWLGFGLDGIMTALVLSGIVGYVVSVVDLRFLLGHTKEVSSEVEQDGKKDVFDFSSVRGYAVTVLTGTLGIVILGNVDVVLAKHALSPDMAGAYGALSVVARVIFFVTGVLASVLFAMSAESVEKGSEQSHDFSAFRTALLLTAGAVGIAVIVYFLLPNFILGVFFGDKYLAMAPLLGWFALAAGLYAIVNLILQQLLSMHVAVAVRWLLGIAFIEPVALYFFGSSLASFIAIVIGTQTLALISGLAFIRKKGRIG